MNRESSLDESSSAAATRAREILGSLKERRDFFESRIASHGNAEKDHHHHHQQQQQQHVRNKVSLSRTSTGTSSLSSTTKEQVFKPLPIRGAPLFTPEETKDITRQLSWSLQERQSRLSRVCGKTPDNLDKFLAHKASTTQIRTPQQQQQYLGFRSPSSNHSAYTAETFASTASPNSSPGNFSISEQDRLNCSDDIFSSIPRPPTLDEIKESLHESKSKEETASSRASSFAEDSHLTRGISHDGGERRYTAQNCHEVDEDKDVRGGPHHVVSTADLKSEEMNDDVASSSSSAQHERFFSGPQHIQSSNLTTTPDFEPELSVHQRKRSSSSIPSVWTRTDDDYDRTVVPMRSQSSTIFRQSQPFEPPVSDTFLSPTKSLLKDFSRQSKDNLTTCTQREFLLANQKCDQMRMQPSFSSTTSASMNTKEGGDMDIGQLRLIDSSIQKSKNHPEDSKLNAYKQNQQLEDHESQLLSISLANEDDRRMLLRILRNDLEAPDNVKSRQIQLVPLSTSPLTVEDDTVIISDESSFECSTDDTNTSGWDSGEDDGEELDDASDIDVVVEKKQKNDVHVTSPPTPSLNRKTTGESGRPQASIKVYRTTGPISLLAGQLNDTTIDEVSVEEENDNINCDLALKDGVANGSMQEEVRASPVLYVTEEVADELCGTNGGLYTLALLSGLTENIAVPEMRAISLPSEQRGHLCLSPDFRCGAHGSLYDIAVRSGCEIEMPNPKRDEEVAHLDASRLHASAPAGLKKQMSPRKRKKFPSRSVGGLYYIAFKSGLTREAMLSKQGYTISTRTDRLPFSEFDGEIVPTHISNRTCGTSGSLFLALESGMNPLFVDAMQR